MGMLEEKIKAFVKSQGVELVGVAGPDRLDGPPSLDPTYTMKGARSIVSMALPMDPEGVYDYLGKKSYVPHNIDQLKQNRRMNGISEMVAGYIRSLGYRAEVVRANANYRRSLYPFALHPSFSHRFGAIAAGIGAQGWSGNVMTEEYGAANYLGTVVTDAVLESDPLRFGPRHFIDNYCKYCKLCDKTCAARMFREDGEEYVLLNGALHPRAKRNDINLCNATCFGLHGVSPDKKFSSWGFGWIKPWMKKSTDRMSKPSVIFRLVTRMYSKGDSAPRFKMIGVLGKAFVPEPILEEYLNKHPEKLGYKERVEAYSEFSEKVGIKGCKSDRLLVCGNCGLVCGPDVKESAKRYRLLASSGLAVPGPAGEMVVVPTYEEAAKLYTKRLPNVSTWAILKDMVAMTVYVGKNYTGFEPKSFFGGMRYAYRLKKAVADRIEGHKDSTTVGVYAPSERAMAQAEG